MADTKGFTKAKSQANTSRIKASRQVLIASQNISVGAILPTDAKAEKMRDMLARVLDVTHNWPIRMSSGKMPAPIVANGFLVIALPVGGHVIQNSVTSKGGQNFIVDNVAVIPVTSEEK
jgi:hypothetical protein